ELNAPSGMIVHDVPLYSYVGHSGAKVIAHVYPVAVLSARAGRRIDTVPLDHVTAYEDITGRYQQYTAVFVVMNPVVLDRVVALINLYSFPAVPDLEPLQDRPFGVELDPGSAGIGAALCRILAVARV